MSASATVPGRTRTPLAPLRDWNRAGWRIAQVANVLVTVALIVGLVFWSETALAVMWNLLLPVLPISFLIAPQLWRGICPLATLNHWSGSVFGRRQLRGRLLTAANAFGILLLVLLVPARRFLLNDNGPALAATIVLVAAAAVILGVFFNLRAGFCNGICPVLPVERLYGQHPLLRIDNRRCDTCSLCIPRGCLDQDPAKSLAQAVGSAGSRPRWLITPYGIFAAALPGFIIGYYTTSNGSWAAAIDVYLWVVLCSAGSYLATAVVVRLLALTGPLSLALLASTAIMLYYWWAVPSIAEWLDVAGTPVLFARAAVLTLVSFWLVRAWRRLQTPRRRTPAHPAPQPRHPTATEAVRQEYDRLAPSYDRRWRAYVDATLGAVVGMMKLQGHEQILDIACGTGELQRRLLTRWPNLQTVGTDLSTGMLQQGLAKQAEINASWVLADATRLPFRNHSFDYAVCANSFHYFCEPGKALQEGRRVLRPGGRFLFVDWCDDYWSCKLCSWWLRLTDPAFCRTYTLRRCRELLKASGFEVIQANRFRVRWIWGMMQLECQPAVTAASATSSMSI